MRPLDEIEAVLSRLVEKPFTQRTQGKPSLDFRSLLRQLGNAAPHGAFTVALNPNDHAALLDLIPQLESALNQALAENNGGTHAVTFTADPWVAPGCFEVRAGRSDRTQLQPTVLPLRRKASGLVLRLEGRPPVEVHHTPFRIGRALDNDLVIDHATVSRYHAVLELNGASFFLTDLRSSNGTYLNGRRIHRSRLGRRDIVRVGQVEIRVERS